MWKDLIGVVSEEMHKVFMGTQNSPTTESSEGAYEGARLAPPPSQMRGLSLHAFSEWTEYSTSSLRLGQGPFPVRTMLLQRTAFHTKS